MPKYFKKQFFFNEYQSTIDACSRETGSSACQGGYQVHYVVTRGLYLVVTLPRYAKLDTPSLHRNRWRISSDWYKWPHIWRRESYYEIRIDNAKGYYSLLLLPITLIYFLSVVWLFLMCSVILGLLTLRLLMSYIYGAPSKARNANVVYILTYVWQRWNSLFLFAAQCFNTESMQRGFLCHICV